MTLKALPALAELESIIRAGDGQLSVSRACEVTVGDAQFPVYVVALGTEDPDMPAVAFLGGVHGLERIGTEVVLAYLRSIVERLQWDDTLARQLERLRLVFIPIVNPGGMARGTRANPNGVDLMRNAPIDSSERVPFLVGGQRISAAIPWYRGPAGAPMEVESMAVCRVVEQELLSRPFSLSLDCHSGFGLRDRIWFPYAHTPVPPEHLGEMHALKGVFDQSHPYHHYIFEPQSHQYLTHGDLWDFLYAKSVSRASGVFLPMTLEMGSWLWIKKNPRQLLSRHGIFNPLIEHRQLRVLRRHLAFMEFLTRAACSYRRWLPVGEARARHRSEAFRHWYVESA